MDTLKLARSALEESLLDPADFDQIKAAFVKAQQIKAGFDAGLLTDNDFGDAKSSFLASLCGEPSAPAPAAAPVQLVATPPEHVEVGAAPSADQAPTAVEVAAPVAAEPAPAPLPVATPAVRTMSVASPSPPVGRGRSESGVSKFGRSVSGYGVTGDCVTTYKQLLNKSAYSFMTFKLDEANGMVIADEVGPKGETFGDFRDVLPDGQPRYAVYDYAYKNDDGCQFNKIIFVMWSPESSPLKSKMLYASSKDYFKQHLDGVALEIQATDADDLDATLVHEKVREVLTRK